MNPDSTTRKGILEAAIQYAKDGLRVLPTYWPDPNEPGHCGCGRSNCSSPGKHPLTEHGVKDATTDLDVIREWWKRWPNANVAVEPGNDEFVVDVDPRNGGNGSLKQLEAKHGAFRTKKVRTGSGGLHIWFKTPSPIRSHNAMLPGIDIKAAGGYVLMPPSQHVEGKYVLEDGSVAVRAPNGLIDQVDSTNGPGETRALTPEQLETYRAPGETEEDRLRWTRSPMGMRSTIETHGLG